jgi:hypothetical protein
MGLNLRGAGLVVIVVVVVLHLVWIVAASSTGKSWIWTLGKTAGGTNPSHLPHVTEEKWNSNFSSFEEKWRRRQEAEVDN